VRAQRAGLSARRGDARSGEDYQIAAGAGSAGFGGVTVACPRWCPQPRTIGSRNPSRLGASRRGKGSTLGQPAHVRAGSDGSGTASTAGDYAIVLYPEELET
jgi:hypothetical protein